VAFGIRAARTRLLDGGTTLSLLPLTTRVGARIEPRNGMLDQFDTASDCHNRPRGIRQRPGHAVKGVPEAAKGVRLVTWCCHLCRKRWRRDQPTHPVWGIVSQLLSYCAPKGVPENVRVSQASSIKHLLGQDGQLGYG